MRDNKNTMHISNYDYQFPEEATALFPPKVRGESKLFVVYTQTGKIEITTYSKLAQYLGAGDLVVRNTSKVLKARLIPQKTVLDASEIPGKFEVFILSSETLTYEEYLANNAKENGFVIKCLVRGKRNKLKIGAKFTFTEEWIGEITAYTEDYAEIIFQSSKKQASVHDFLLFIQEVGHVPIPPYLKREDVAQDEERYQTIFSNQFGSVAAPTASLNFTQSLENELKEQNVRLTDVILHVGLGTFKPLTNEVVEQNKLHTETFFVPAASVNELRLARSKSRRIVAIGTTALRTLESMTEIPTENKDISGNTDIFIYPPYDFKIADTLLTNFHQPKSSLIVLVDAFLQWKQSKLSWKQIYEFAIQNEAKLFSYGDSMLIL